MATTLKFSTQKVFYANSASQDKVKNLYKLMNITGNNKIFDK